MRRIRKIGEYDSCTEPTGQGNDFELIITVKISPVRRLTVDSSQLTFMPTLKSRGTKTRPNIKNPARSNLDIVP